jgi:glycogen debranching enzyme
MLLNRVLDRSLRDLRALRSYLDGKQFFAAGVPWFVTLFGRDSLLVALQTLSFDPTMAEETLRLLAQHQGRKVDDYRDEQPGKILHEYRDGEMARTGEIPHSPYYGTVDATPLFLILLGRHAAWTGRLDVFEDLRDNVERALDWIDTHGDADGDGYVEYQSVSEKGLINQGWKDSGDAIVNADGRLARPRRIECQGNSAPKIP